MGKFLIGVFVSVVLVSFSVGGHSGVTARVSVSSAGEAGNSHSYVPSINGDGRYVAFESDASDLVPDDTNGSSDVFVHDRQTGETTRVSVSSAGEQGNDASVTAAICADGRYVAFHSRANNLVAGDTNPWPDIFVHDRQTGETTRVSVSSAGEQADGSSYAPSISGDGWYVAFESYASTLVPGDTKGKVDVFVHHRQTGETRRVSVSSAGEQADDGSYGPSVSGDGQYVAFRSFASNLVPVDTNETNDVFVHDWQTGETTRVSISSAGEQGNDQSYHSSISGDGQYVAFTSEATHLVPGDTNGVADIFVHYRQTGETTRVSVSTNGDPGNDDSRWPSITTDGRYVAFRSDASNLGTGDTNGVPHIFIHDRQTGETTRVSVSSRGEQADGDSGLWSGPSISAVGRYLTFDSVASNLVPCDTNEKRDIFVYDRQTLSQTKTLPDGDQAIASGNAATASFPGYFYIEDADRAGGIKVSWAGPIAVGDRFRVDGTLATGADGERVIVASNARRIDPSGCTDEALPMGVLNRSLGGADWYYDEPTGAGQKGIAGAFGLNNIGLLVRVWGRVISVGADYFVIDDGSGVEVRCVIPAGVILPDLDDYVSVTGISSCEDVGGDLIPLLRVREQADIVVLP